MVRGDMDALPVVEKTRMPYASKVRAVNGAGVELPNYELPHQDVFPKIRVHLGGRSRFGYYPALFICPLSRLKHNPPKFEATLCPQCALSSSLACSHSSEQVVIVGWPTS